MTESEMARTSSETKGKEIKTKKQEVLNVIDLADIHDPTLYEGAIELDTKEIKVRGILLSRSTPVPFPTAIVLEDGREISLLGPYDFVKYNKFQATELKNYFVLRLSDVNKYDQVLTVYVPEELKDKVMELRFGEEIIVKGIIREIFKRTKVIRYFQAFDISRTEGEVKISEDGIKKLKTQIIDKLFNEDPDDIANFFFPHIFGLEDLKLSALAVAVSGGAKVLKEAGEKNGAIHALIFSKTGGAKSLIGDVLVEIMRGVAPCVYADANKATAVGLCGGVDMLETGQRVIRAGLLPMANGGILILDELDKIKDPNDLAGMNTAMSDGHIMISKAGLYAKFDAYAGILAFANPFDLDKLQRRLSNVGLIESLKGHESFYDRFAAILYYEPIMNKAVFLNMLRQREFVEGEKRKARLKRKLLVAMRMIYQKLLASSYDHSIKEYLLDKAEELAEILSSLGDKAISRSPRIFEHLERLAMFFTSLRLRDKVTEEDIDSASEFLKRTARFKPDLIVRLGGYEQAYIEARSVLLKLCKEQGREISHKELWDALLEQYQNDKEVFEMLFGKEPKVESNRRWRRVIERLRKDPDIIWRYGSHREVLLWHKRAGQKQSDQYDQSDTSTIPPKTQIYIEESSTYIDAESKGVSEKCQTSQTRQTSTEPKIEPIMRIIINHLAKVKMDTLDNIHRIVMNAGFNISKEDLLKLIKKYAEQGIFMITEKEFNGKRIILVRLLRNTIIHGGNDLRARILELCKGRISEEELFEKLKGEGYTHKEIMKAIEELIEKGKLLFLRGEYRLSLSLTR